MPHYPAGSLKGRGPPPRQRRQPTIPEDGSQHGASSSASANSVGAYRVRPYFDGDSHSETNIRVSVTDIPTNHRNSTPNIVTLPNNTSIVPQPTKHDPHYVAGPDSFSNTSQLYRKSSSPLENPSSQNTSNSYPVGGQTPAGTIDPPTHSPPNIQPSSYPSTQQLSQKSFNTLVPRAVTWHSSGYGGSWAESRSNSPRRHSQQEILQLTPHQSIPQGTLEGDEYANNITFSNPNNDSRLAQGRASLYPIAKGSNQTISNWYRPADNCQAIPSQAEDPQAFDIQAGINSLQFYEGENASYTTSSSEMLNEGFSASKTTTRSQSINSISSTYSSRVSDENGPSSRPLNGLNDSVIPTGFALQRSQQEYNTDMSDDTNPFQWEVEVWQNDERGRRTGPRVRSIQLRFDTQCEKSNWVAKKIVDQLGAETVDLEQSREFIGFNGQPIIASSQTTLWFEAIQGGSTKSAVFLVSSVVPFDILLGADDCVRLDIIQRPRFLGLAARKQSKDEKKVEEERTAEHASKVEERSLLVQKMKEAQRQQDRERNNMARSSSSRSSSSSMQKKGR